MGLAPIDAAGVGQPLRIDQNGDAYQQRIRQGANLEIPQTGVDRSRNDNTGDRSGARTAAQNLFTQDQATQDRGQRWETRQLQTWERYSNGGERQQPPSAAVVIDQGLKRNAERDPLTRRPRPPDEDTEAWKKWKQAHVGAAESEEYAQDRLGPYMSTPKEAKRRRYTILNSR